MPSNLVMILMVLSMALVTYLIRVIPFVFLRRKIKSKFICSLLYYVPYSVLATMTFPVVFYCTQSLLTATLGAVAAIITAIFRRSLITVAVIACLTVLAVGFFI